VEPSSNPSAEPTAVPTLHPSAVPSAEPTTFPTLHPSAVPSAEPTAVPSSAPTGTGFTNCFDISTWTQVDSTNGGGGSIFANPDSVTLVSNNDFSFSFAVTRFFKAVSCDTTISTSWTYSTVDGSPFYDPFFIIIGGNTLVTVNSGPVNQSGSLSNIVVLAGQTIEFQVQSIDSIAGSSTAIVFDFTYDTCC
jgi:PT repeat